MKSEIHNCSALELIKKVDADSVDLILTDPPYPKEYIHCYGELARLAVHALRPGASCLALSSQVWMHEILNQMRVDGLKYHWTLCMEGLNRGGECMARNVINIGWKPILWHVKPPMDKRFQIRDTINGGGKDKRFHHWGQGIEHALGLIRKFKITEGMTICDPFLGGGTYAVAASSLGINFVGCDIDAKAVSITKNRLKTEVQVELI